MTQELSEAKLAILERFADSDVQDLVAEVRKYRALLSEERHIIRMTYGEWTIQHPLRERFDGSLFDCTAAVSWTSENLFSEGTFVLNDDGTIGEAIENGKER